MTKHDTQRIGKQAELKACLFLQKQGLTLLQQNYLCFHGEIDLIMKDKDDIVFVEVRYRTHKDYGSALESVTKTKMNKLIKTASHFLQKKNWLYKVNSRFDIIAIHTIANKLQFEWVKHAFSVEN